MRSLARLTAIVAAVIIVSLIKPPEVARALSYVCDYDLRVRINADLSARIEQQLNIANTSQSEVVTEINFNLPYNIYDVLLKPGPLGSTSSNTIPTSFQGKILTLHLGEQMVKQESSSSFDLSYTVADLVSMDTQGRKTLQLPEQVYCENPNSKISFSYPEEWGAPDYLEQGATIYAVWGKYSDYALDLRWQLEHGKIVPLPGSNFNELTISFIPDLFDVYRDHLGNEFLDLSNSAAVNASLQGLVYQREGPAKLPELSGPYFEGDILGLLEFSTELTLEQQYSELLRIFNPEKLVNSRPQMDLAEALARPYQDSLSYALAWSALLENAGRQPYIVYGPVEIPGSSVSYFGYWVGEQTSDGWQQYDPYLEDLSGLANYEHLTPKHYNWGILDKENLFLVAGFGNLSEPSALVVYNEATRAVQGDSFGLRAELVVQDELARKVGLKVTNLGSHIVFIENMHFSGMELPGHYLENLGVMPRQSKYIDLSPFLDWRQILSGKGELTGALGVTSNGKPIEVQVAPVLFQRYWIYPLLFVIFFLFYVLLFILGRLTILKLARLRFNLSPVLIFKRLRGEPAGLTPLPE